jgi:hypothetical protein
MSQPGRLFLLCILYVGVSLAIKAQTNASIEAPTGIQKNADSARTKPPKTLTFTASTDQRFFFFKDTRNDNNRRVPVSVYGLRMGFLVPSSRSCSLVDGKRAVAFKVGAGFYFTNQDINRPGLLPNTSESVTRKLRIVMGFCEPYLLQKKAFVLSMPIELGYGHSRYERSGEQAGDYELARGVFVPLGVGVAAAYHFPNPRWFRPLHWFGFNVLTGYRFILKKDVLQSNINYNGLYISVGPSFFLENLTADIKAWRRRRK